MSRRKRARAQLNRADQISWFLLVFGLVRMTAWLVMMAFTLLGLVGVTTFEWAYRVADLVVFVALISYYANAATDLDAVTAAWAAIRAGKAHAQGVANEGVVRDDVLARLEALSEAIYDHALRSERE